MNKEIIWGTSFSPEYSWYLGDKDPLETLRVIREDLNIQDFRLGLRWNTVEKNKKVSLGFYEKYLDYLLKSNCNICLNVGPIKVMRWPEEHIPEYIDVEERSVVKKDSELAKYAFEYFQKLLVLLKENYGKEKNISFQIENECYNRFGHKRLLMSDEYLIEIANILHEFFPKNNLMMDSAARKDLRKLLHLFEILVQKDLYKWKQLTVGINYYSMVPEIRPLLKRIEALTFFYPWSMPLSNLKKLQKQYDFGLEISEAQFEPWGSQTLPGNSLEELKYVAKHCLKIFPDDYKGKVIRLWGMEEFGLKMKEERLTSEHKEIIENFFV